MGSGRSGLDNNKMSFTDHNSFFGNVHKVSNKYFIPEKQVIDDDNIIIATNNIKAIKGNPVMIVGPNQAVYVNRNIAGLNIRNGEFSAYDNYAVKLNRQKYKTYTFRNGFDEFSFDKTQTFDDLLKIAKQQEKAKNKYSTHSIYISNSSISHK